MVQPWSAEKVVSESLAHQLIEEQYDLLTPVHLRMLGEGFDNTVYEVNHKYVFRFPRREIAVDLLKTENKLLPVLAPLLPLSIPEPVFFGQPAKNYPWPFTGYRIVYGVTPGRLTDDQRLRAVKPLAQFLHALHRFSVSEAKGLGVPFDELNRLDIAVRKPKLEQHIEQILARGIYEDREVLLNFLPSVNVSEYRQRETLVHGDLHFRNMLVEPNGSISGIIDWGDTHIGNPAIDLAIVYSFLPREGRRLFYDIYGQVNEEEKRVAQFKAVYTTVLLLLYGHDKGDAELVKAAKETLRLALDNL